MIVSFVSDSIIVFINKLSDAYTGLKGGLNIFVFFFKNLFFGLFIGSGFCLHCIYIFEKPVSFTVQCSKETAVY